MALCKICGNSNDNKPFTIREMMYGFRDEFEYFECSNCGCLQIVTIPYNLQKYYPSQYYSFKDQPVAASSISKKLLDYLRHQRITCLLRNYNDFNILLFMMYGKPFPKWLQKANLAPDSNIIDIGCGSGKAILCLQKAGFTNLIGIDPFIDEDIIYSNKLRILKKNMFEIDQKFDFVMLHHSLEHMPDQINAFKHLLSILKPNAKILIRTPISSSYAWKRYNVNWVQIDAPRHLFIHSLKSLEFLAKQSGIKIVDYYFDSTSFQFWGSEQYINDIPLFDMNSYKNNPRNSIFPDSLIRRFEKQARELNDNGYGDQGCFYLKAI